MNAFVIATICGHIDVLAAPSRDPRVNHKLKRDQINMYVMNVLSFLID